MKWIGRRESGNVEDRRGFSGGGMVIGGGIGVTIIYFIIQLLFGGDGNFSPEQAAGPQTDAESGAAATGDAAEDSMAHFAAVVLADNEDVWNTLFSRQGQRYQEPSMVLFRQHTESACGMASSATGPFYCPADEKVYLDLSFFTELQDRFGAAGDFASAYVIAHEVGHHVQHLLGTSGRIQQAMQNVSREDANRLSVALELQADFYAGVWAHHNQRMKQVMEAGDLEEALNAASAIGDDRLQKMSGGEVMPDAFTHGTSEQRRRWFKKGFDTGDPAQGNTFEALK